ncbi:MAG: glutaredoxin [Pseudomonadota bacterium]
MMSTILALVRRALPRPPEPDSPETARQLAEFTASLSLFHFSTCPYCRRVRRHLKRLNIEVELRDINVSAADRDVLVSGGGRATVPCLRIARPAEGVTWMYESADIVNWLTTEVDRIRRATG